MEHSADLTLAVARDHHERVVVVLALERVHRHREAPLRRASPSALDNRLDLPDGVRIERPQPAQLRLVAGLAQPRDRLADLADRPPLEREPPELDDRLVPQIDRPQAQLLVERAERLTGAERAELQPTALGELVHPAHQVRERVLTPDRVAR